ncbi:carotenoid-cleaving dioxygenase, mitochondrial isoform X2 [Astyanax mexicanus]|uniref:carotenoid-cleaving dioxygenase, mitochondrial isoform X2 n=1 Tax=Astyanax mexicanus TaxID=7994 RepID=UPI0020CB04DF|nr:carotenoid-cleaving dioxygenase, mitochondrial isoform X2 [Astyanax mexicanus]
MRNFCLRKKREHCRHCARQWIARHTRFLILLSARSLVTSSFPTMAHVKSQGTVANNKQNNGFKEQHGLQCIAPLVRTAEETPEPIPTTVKGTIPSWIRGSLLRNGPGKFEFGNQHFNHWFDGMALMHRFEIMDGQVTYRSRFLRSDSYNLNSEKNRIMVSEFGTMSFPDPCKNLFQRFLSRFEMMKPTDNASVNFVKYKGDYYVSTETNFMHKVDPDNLETKEKVDWSKFIAVNGATAHPHFDPDGTAYNMGNSYGRKGALYNIISVPPEKDGNTDTLQGAKVLCSVIPTDKARPSYYHSFAMSENYVVIIEQSVKMDLFKIATARLRNKNVSNGVYWDPKQETVFHLVNKHTGEVSPVKYHTTPLSTFHQINAFEEDGFLMMDLCGSDDGKAINTYLIQNLRKTGEALDEVYNSMGRAFPRRYVLPLNITNETPLQQNLNTRPNSSATAVCHSSEKVFCTSEDLHDEDLLEYGGLEFPQIYYSKYNTKPYRYFYGCGFRHLVGDSLIKMDLNNKKLKAWHQPGFYPSEPVFVPSPEAEEEDDGVILSVVLTPTEDNSTFLLVLDAKTFEEMGRAEVPVNIPYGFHGVFNAA